MNAGEFVSALYSGGGTNLFDERTEEIEYCPVHGWHPDTFADQYHQDICPAYAAKLELMTRERNHP
mgnify:CR=1 FL=1